MPVASTVPVDALAPTTPRIRLALLTRPSLTPKMAARRLPPPMALWPTPTWARSVGSRWPDSAAV